MAYDWNGKRVLVTGGSSGIGAALAERLAAQGAVVGIVARRADQLQAVLDRCTPHSPESRLWSVDLADLDAVDRLAASVIADFGPLDVLINNAGMPKRKGVLDIDADTVQQVMHLNYVSPVRLTLALLPHLVERGGGLVVNVSSVAATLSSPGEGAYDASKAALAVFSEAMAIDLWDTGVKVLTVYPGVVDTPLFQIPDNDPLPPDITPIPVDEFLDGMLAAIDEDRREVYVPAWFKDVVKHKTENLDGFLQGSADYVRNNRQA
jgi:short-subunit dehydrogenase